MNRIRNRATPEGAVLGEKLAQWCDDAEPQARLRMPELPPRCNSCAFRKGPHLANGSPSTQMDVLKCLIEGHEFYCHEPARDGHLCSGWAMMMLAKTDPGFGRVPWEFSQEATPMDDTATMTEREIETTMEIGERLKKRLGSMTMEFIADERLLGNEDFTITQAVAMECMVLAAYMTGQTRESFVDSAAKSYDVANEEGDAK